MNQSLVWFKQAVGTPTPIQAEGWPAIASGENVLISAPTGSGKTLAAFLSFIDDLKERADAGELRDELYVIYISPLKALGNDIQQNLRRPLRGLGCEHTIRVGIRTGDTEQKERAAMLRRPPHILITTPESLYLLLTSKGGRVMLCTARAVIIDELHAVLSTKRGTHLFLSLARLDSLCGRKLQRIGLSATVQPLQLAAACLAPDAPVRVIAPGMRKDMKIIVKSAAQDMRVLPEKSIWPEMARELYRHCLEKRAVLCFLEGRAQAEKLAYAVNQISPGLARTHHGCVSKEQRLEAERDLRQGRLKLLCATSSMELGIDVGDIDLVVQIGCPRTISSTLQRLGRAGHNPGRESLMIIYPKTPSDALYCALTAQAARRGAIEKATPPEMCLDVLAQHLTSMATARDYDVDEALAIVRGAYPYRSITREDIQSVLRMLAGDWEHEQDRPARARVLYDRVHDRVSGDAYSRMLAVSTCGTIPDRGMYPVTLSDGTRLGELDEEYVFEARLGDTFMLGAYTWRITQISRDRVVVAQASTVGAQTPFWKGDGAGRAYETGVLFGQMLRKLADAGDACVKQLSAMGMDKASAQAAQGHIKRQLELTGCLPDDKTVILEHFKDEAGEHQLMVHSVLGKRVNYPLSLLLQREASACTGTDVRGFEDDDGCLLYLIGGRELPEGLLYRLDPDGAEALLRALMPATTLFSMVFRYNAGRALMLGARTGKRQPLWIQRLRGAESQSGVAGDPSHPLMRESLRQCMEDEMDIPALIRLLRDVRAGIVRVHELHTPTPSPMSLPLRRQVEGTMMYEYFPIPKAAHNAAREAELKLAPEKSELNKHPSGKAPTSAARLHETLLQEGDIVFGETDAPLAWLEQLAGDGQCAYIEPGLWIAAEDADLYARALQAEDGEALQKIARRCLHYRGAQDACTLSQRYFIAQTACQKALSALEARGEAILDDGLYYHAANYRSAQARTLQNRRAQAQTFPPERYAALLARKTRFTGSAKDQLARGLRSLLGLSFTPAWWESALLPLRVPQYRPSMLDAALAQGEAVFSLDITEGKQQLSFFDPSDVDLAGELPAQGLDEDEQTLLAFLRARGASFTSALSLSLDGRPALPALISLVQKGLVHADSLAPVRYILSGEEPTARRNARARVAVQGAGRWEASKPRLTLSPEQKLLRAFARYDIVTRETCEGLPWSDALTVLRAWEYEGRVRRGYFVRGFSSGAQFILETEYARVQAALLSRDGEAIWMPACDPMQAYGAYLPKAQGFLRVPGTLVALEDGEVSAVLEAGGARLRARDDRAVAALARDFLAKRLYPDQTRLTLRKYPDELRGALQEAGFRPEMNDLTLWR